MSAYKKILNIKLEQKFYYNNIVHVQAYNVKFVLKLYSETRLQDWRYKSNVMTGDKTYVTAILTLDDRSMQRA